MIHKISYAVCCIVKRTVCILRLKDKVQIFCGDLSILLLGEIQRCPHQEKRSVGASVYDSTRVISHWGIGTGSSIHRGLDIPVVQKRMLSYRLHDLPPFRVLIDLAGLSKSLVNIGHGCYKRDSLCESAASR